MVATEPSTPTGKRLIYEQAARALADEWSEKAAALAVDAYRAEQSLIAARALADELGKALSREVAAAGCKPDCPSRAALAKWEASR